LERDTFSVEIYTLFTSEN